MLPGDGSSCNVDRSLEAQGRGWYHTIQARARRCVSTGHTMHSELASRLAPRLSYSFGGLVTRLDLKKEGIRKRRMPAFQFAFRSAQAAHSSWR